MPELLPVSTRLVNGKLQIGTIEFQPNTLLKRNGKFYMVDKHGTQRRVKPEDERELTRNSDRGIAESITSEES